MDRGSEEDPWKALLSECGQGEAFSFKVTGQGKGGAGPDARSMEKPG